ncbi:MAG: hypothetical protein H0V17_20130 [Deltaproteobacteria bacterium]|nr:hypothetical protein [Deltaproteobacteria bacterium]
MKLLMTLAVVLAACSGPKSKPESPLVNEGSSAKPEDCCCKTFPLTSEDGKPSYENSNRMECSTKQGECVDEIQCQKPPTPADPPTP